MSVHLVPRVAVLVGVLLAACVGVAGATPIGQITEFAAPGSNIAQVRAGPDGNLWFTDRAGAIGQITTGGVITRFTSGLNPGTQPFSDVVGPDGNIWFTDAGTSPAIGMLNPTTHAISEFGAGLNPGSQPAGIAVGPDGNLWFTDRGATRAVGSINPATHAIAEYSTGLNPGSNPQQGITAGPDGNMWFTDQGTTRAVGMLNPTTHAIVESSAGLNPGSAPGAAIAVGTDGNLWFTDNSSVTPAIGTINPTTHAIAEFGTGAGSVPGRLAVGPDGNVWFTDKGTTPAIGFIDPTTHAITKFSAGLNAGSLPGGINTGSDGNLWFTDQGTIRAMGRAGTDAAAASVTAPSVGGRGYLGATQTCGGDTWSNWAGQQPSRSVFGFDGYRWLLDGSPIAGATDQSYTPTADQVGHELACTVTATYTLTQVTVSASSSAVTIKGAAEQLVDLQALVGSSVDIKHHTRHKLLKELEKAGTALAHGDTDKACHRLGKFVEKVEHLKTPEQISVGEQEELIADATRIRTVLGC